MSKVVIKLNGVVYDNGWELQLARAFKVSDCPLVSGYVNYRLSATAATLCVRVDFKFFVRKRVLRFPMRKGCIIQYNV